MILVFCEAKDNAIRKSSLEVLSEARRLANTNNLTVAALFLGTADNVSEMSAQYGADVILNIDAASLSQYSSDLYAKAIVEAVKTKGATIVLSAATAISKDIMPRVAARLNAGYASEVTKIGFKDGKLECTRPVYSGKALADVAFHSTIQVATVRPNILEITKNPKAVAKEALSIAVETPLAAVTKAIAKDNDSVDITEANIIVAGGRGLEDVANVKLIEELANALPGGVIGASRAAVDAGWNLPHSVQVGQTGKAVSPDLYIACGISGAIQHVSGMTSSKTIIAINKDPEAPIFKVATYGIVGNILEVLPTLTKAIQENKNANK